MPPFLKEYVQWIPDLGATPVAVVDFELKEDAQKACREVNMENRSDKSLRCALLKPGARIRRTLYRRYKEDEIGNEMGDSKMGENNNKMKHDKRLSIGSGGSEGGGGYCRTSSESVRSTVTMYPSVLPVINKAVATNNMDVHKVKSVSKKFITLESTRKDELFGKTTSNFVTNFSRKLEQPCSKIIRHPRGPGNNQRGFSIEYQNARKAPVFRV